MRSLLGIALLTLAVPVVRPTPHLQWYYDGPHADEVQYLLSRSDGWKLPSCASCGDLKARDIPINPNAPLRDTYVGAAITKAFGAEAYAKVGQTDKAEEWANGMHEELQHANALCSDAPTMDARGGTPATLKIWGCPPPIRD